MVSRVTQATFFRELTRGVARIQRDLAVAQETVSTQKRLHAASDDPTAVARSARLRTDMRGFGALREGIGFGIAVLGAEDAALDQAESILLRAREIATQQASGLTSVAARQQAAGEVAELERGLLGIGNTAIGGRYVFAGLATGALPFAGLDDPGFDPTTAYGGPTETFAIHVGPTETLRLTTAGDAVLGPAIVALDDLRQTLAAGNPPTASIDAIETAAETLRAERASVGARQARLTDRTAELDTAVDGARTLLASIEDADPAAAISELVQLQTALQATLASAQALQTSILDFLRL